MKSGKETIKSILSKFICEWKKSRKISDLGKGDTDDGEWAVNVCVWILPVYFLIKMITLQWLWLAKLTFWLFGIQYLVALLIIYICGCCCYHPALASAQQPLQTAVMLRSWTSLLMFAVCLQASPHTRSTRWWRSSAPAVQGWSPSTLRANSSTPQFSSVTSK